MGMVKCGGFSDWLSRKERESREGGKRARSERVGPKRRESDEERK
jgi:hypothetical protein